MIKDKKISELTLKNVLFIITFIILLIICAIRFDSMISIVSTTLDLLDPFLLAIAFAFIFNIPLSYFMRKLPRNLKKGRKAIAVCLALACIIVVLYFIFRIVSPQVIESINVLIKNIPAYAQSTIQFVEERMSEEVSQNVLQQIMEKSEEIEKGMMALLQTSLPKLFSITTGIFSTITNIVLAVVIAIYMTISKDKLINQTKRVFYAFLPSKQYHYLVDTVKLSATTFASFISGQLIEAIIIGVLCYLGCIILRIEYAPILGVIIGCTNVIPIFGPIIGTGIGALLLLFASPWQAIIFIIFGIALQQFESNLIYPRVVGNSVGLSGLWTLMAVSIGGGLFGILGMVLGLPTFAVIYRLFANEVNRRTKRKRR